MLTATANEQQVLAQEVTKQDGPFFCPDCGQEMVLRKGRVKTHHFAHRVDMGCLYGSGETELHRRTKQEIYQALRAWNVPCALECQIANQRADILAVLNGHFVAVEVQASALGIKGIYQRTLGYSRAGIAVFWVVPGQLEEDPNYYDAVRVKYWQRYLHGLYFGRLYVHVQDDVFQPVHLDQIDYLKTIKMPMWGTNRRLSHKTSFQVTTRTQWTYESSSNQEISYPASKLLIDTDSRWW